MRQCGLPRGAWPALCMGTWGGGVAHRRLWGAASGTTFSLCRTKGGGATPTPASFFQPLYTAHDGNFQVKASPTPRGGRQAGRQPAGPGGVLCLGGARQCGAGSVLSWACREGPPNTHSPLDTNTPPPALPSSHHQHRSCHFFLLLQGNGLPPWLGCSLPCQSQCQGLYQAPALSPGR